MSGRYCAICGEPNWNWNETVVSVKRVEYDSEPPHYPRTIMYEWMVCDGCLARLPEFLGEKVTADVRAD